MNDAFLYKVYIFHSCIITIVFILLYKLTTNSINQQLFYLAGSMEL